MPSSARKGAYWKGRTKKYLEKAGWQVGDLEVVRWIQPPGRDRMPVKRDQFGADLLCVNAETIVFVQVKGGKQKNLAKARRAFEGYTFPPCSKQWLIFWKPRAHEPDVIDMSGRA